MTKPVNGNGHGNFKLPPYWSQSGTNNALEGLKEIKISTPIKMTYTDSVQRQELGFINPYNESDTTIANAREIASTTNEIMTGLGYANFKVSPKVVASVTEGVNQYTLPAMNLASDNAVAARVADPKGPFADVFA